MQSPDCNRLQRLRLRSQRQLMLKEAGPQAESLLGSPPGNLRMIVLLREMRQDEERRTSIIVAGKNSASASFDRCPTRDITRCFTDQGYGPVRSISKS